MIRTTALAGNATREQLSAEQVDSVESPAFRIEPEDGDSELFGPHPGSWKHTGSHKDQCLTAVRRRHRSRPLHTMDVKIAALVVDPRETSRTVDVAHLSCSSVGRDSVRSAEVDHPLAAQFDCFVVRSTPRLRLRRLPFHETSLPETSVVGPGIANQANEMSVLARSLAPPSWTQCDATTGDWS